MMTKQSVLDDVISEYANGTITLDQLVGIVCSFSLIKDELIKFASAIINHESATKKEVI